RISLVGVIKGNNYEREGIERGREGTGDETEDGGEESESSNREDIGFRDKLRQNGARLFRNALKAFGLSINAIRSIIDSWHGSCRRHACALSAFWEYMKRKGMSVEQLARIDKPYIIIAEYITDIIKDQTDAFVIHARTSISTMFELMVRQEKNLRNKVIEQLMLQPVSNTRKVIREVTIWKMEQLLDYIVKLSTQRDEGSLIVIELRRMVINIFMVYSVLRLSVIQRAMLDVQQIEQGMIIIYINLLKGKRGKVEVTLKRVENKAACPTIWFEAWNEKRKIKTTDRDLLWKNGENKRSLTPDECSKEVHIVMNSTGIDNKHSITTIRKAAISAMQNKNKTKIEIDRWSRYSELADAVRENYDVNN
ncbi:MAG: hypothetical protein EZS28_049748, partial [Streblomastix strix]